MADDFRQNEVGDRYALALFELARSGDAQDAVREDLRALKAAYEASPDLRRLLTSAAFSAEDKAKGLLAVADRIGVQALTRKFLGLLSRNHRAGALASAITGYIRLYDQARGVVAAQVTTALAMSEAQIEGVRQALAQALGKAPEIETRIDPAILGGLKVRVGSRLYDASLKTKLDQMKFALKRA